MTREQQRIRVSCCLFPFFHNYYLFVYYKARAKPILFYHVYCQSPLHTGFEFASPYVSFYTAGLGWSACIFLPSLLISASGSTFVTIYFMGLPCNYTFSLYRFEYADFRFDSSTRNHQPSMATVAAAGAHALAVTRRALSAMRTKQLSFLSTSLKTGFNLLQLRSTAPAAARKNPIIRAARIESQGVSLGSRAPHFEVCIISENNLMTFPLSFVQNIDRPPRFSFSLAIFF